MNMRTLLCGAMLTAILASTASAAAPRLVPHRAVFDLFLREASTTSGIQSLEGRLVFELQSDCSGYVLNQRIFTESTDASGQAVANDYSVSTWESRDGTLFRFSVRNEVNGQAVEEVDGQATLDGRGGPGAVEFTKPADTTLKLPAGTVFPSEHTVMVLQAAESGRRSLSVPVFDGSGVEGLSNTYTVINRDRGDPAQRAQWPLIADQKAWAVQLAYFPITPERGRTPVETPEMEVSVTLFQNGVTNDLVLDYGDLVLGSRMIELRTLPMPKC